MLSQMDPALVASCEKIDAERGLPSVPDDLGGFSFQHAPVVQMATVTGGSSRLLNLQPEVNLDQSYEGLKRKKKNADPALAGMFTQLVLLFLHREVHTYSESLIGLR